MWRQGLCSLASKFTRCLYVFRKERGRVTLTPPPREEGMTRTQVRLRHRMIAIWRDRDWEVAIGKDLDLSCYVFRWLHKKGLGHLKTEPLKKMINVEIRRMQRADELTVYSFNGCTYWRMSDELLHELTPAKDKKSKPPRQKPHPTPTRPRHRPALAR